jgi:Icc-related predicted phosphoesterase
MKLVFISDTHNQLGQVKIPSGDILIHSGDATLRGSNDEITKFARLYSSIAENFKHAIFVPGNHDYMFQTNAGYAIAQFDPNLVTVLIDKEIIFDGVHFYGSPWQPYFHNWAFNFPPHPEAYRDGAEHIWGNIPEATEVLITHGPSYGILDKVNYPGAREDAHVGCKYLKNRIAELKSLKVHAFGHIHEGYGITNVDGIQRVNAAILDDNYDVRNKPIVVEI